MRSEPQPAFAYYGLRSGVLFRIMHYGGWMTFPRELLPYLPTVWGMAQDAGPVPGNFRVGLAVDLVDVDEDTQHDRLIDGLIEPRE